MYGYHPPVWDHREKSMCVSDDSAGGVVREEKGADGSTVPMMTNTTVTDTPAVNPDQPSVPGIYEYACPHCGGKAYNGDLASGSQFRGSGRCSECDKSFSIVGLNLKPVSNTPVFVHPTKDNPACVMIDMPPEVASVLLRLAGTIDADHLSPKGVENESHVTAFFGLLCSPEEVQKALASFGHVHYQLTKFGVFAGGKKGDVLYVEVISPELHRLNRLLSTLPATESDYDEYKPHVTLAYLKSGLAEVYATAWNGAIQLDASAVAAEVTYSGPKPAKAITKISLTNIGLAVVQPEQVREKGCDHNPNVWSHEHDEMDHPIIGEVTDAALKMFGVGMRHKGMEGEGAEPPKPKMPKVPKLKGPKPAKAAITPPDPAPSAPTPHATATPPSQPPAHSGLDDVLGHALDNPQSARHISHYVNNNPHESSRVAGELAAPKPVSPPPAPSPTADKPASPAPPVEPTADKPPAASPPAKPPKQPPPHEFAGQALGAGKTVTMHAHHSDGSPMYSERITGVRGKLLVGENGNHYPRDLLHRVNARLEVGESPKAQSPAPLTPPAQPSPVVQSDATRTQQQPAVNAEPARHDDTRTFEQPAAKPVHPVQRVEPGKPIPIAGSRDQPTDESDHTSHSMPGLDVSSPAYRSQIGGPASAQQPQPSVQSSAQAAPVQPAAPQHQPIPSAPIDRRNDALDSAFAKPAAAPPKANEGNMRANADLDSVFGIHRPSPAAPAPQPDAQQPSQPAGGTPTAPARSDGSAAPAQMSPEIATHLKNAERAGQQGRLNDPMGGGEGVGQHMDKIPDQVANQYDAHGTGSVDTLGNLLHGGVDKSRKFYSAPLSTVKPGVAQNMGGDAVKGGSPFVVLGHPGQKIADGGAHTVLVDGHHEAAIPHLQKAFPNVRFMPAKNAASELGSGAQLPPRPNDGQPPRRDRATPVSNQAQSNPAQTQKPTAGTHTHTVSYTDQSGRPQTADVQIPPGVHMADFAQTMGKRFGWTVNKIAANGGGEWTPKQAGGNQQSPAPVQTAPQPQSPASSPVPTPQAAGGGNAQPSASPPTPTGGQPAPTGQPADGQRHQFTRTQARWSQMLKDSGHGTLLQVNPGGSLQVRDRSGTVHRMTSHQLTHFLDTGIPPVPDKRNNPGVGGRGVAEDQQHDNPVAHFNREFQRRGLAAEVSGRTPEGEYVVHGHDGRATLLTPDEMKQAEQTGRMPGGSALANGASAKSNATQPPDRRAQAVPPAPQPAVPVAERLPPAIEAKALPVAMRLAKRATTDRNAALLLQRSAPWANKMADMHAHRIAHRFGGDVNKARAALYKVIRHLAFQAFYHGKGGQAVKNVGGVGFRVTRRKGFNPGNDPLASLLGLLAG